MKTKKTRHSGITFTAKDARIFAQVYDVLQGDWREGAQSYLRGYIRLWPRYRQLLEHGVNVRMSPPKLGRRTPLLIIEK